MRKGIINFYSFFIFAIVPLIVTPWRQDIFNDYKIWATIIINVGLLFIIILKCEKNKITTFDKIVLFYAVILILSTVFTENFRLSIFGLPRCREGIFSLISYLFIFYVFYKYHIFSKRIMDIVFIIASIIAIYGIMQFFKIDPLLNNLNNEFRGSITSTIGQRNFVGTYCTLLLPVSIGVFINNGSKRYFIFSVLIFGLLLSCTTRGAWIAFGFYFFIFFLLSIREKIKIKRIIALGLILLMFFGIMNNANKNVLTSRAKTVYSDAKNIDADSSGSNRVYIWKKAVQSIFQKPFLGTGPDTFELIYINNGGDPKKILYYKAHNEYLQIALTEGFIALIVYIAIVGLILLRLLKNFNKGMPIYILFCCICGYLIQACFNISFISTAVIYWAILGIAANLTEK